MNNGKIKVRARRVHPNGMLSDTAKFLFEAKDYQKLLGMIKGNNLENHHRVAFHPNKHGMIFQLKEPGSLPDEGESMILVRVRDVTDALAAE